VRLLHGVQRDAADAKLIQPSDNNKNKKYKVLH
jgi:hypothetical protein